MKNSLFRTLLRIGLVAAVGCFLAYLGGAFDAPAPVQPAPLQGMPNWTLNSAFPFR